MSDVAKQANPDVCRAALTQRADGSWHCPTCGHETGIKTTPKSSERQAAIDAATAELRAELAAAERRAEWAELLAKGFTVGAIGIGARGFYLEVPAGEGMVQYQDATLEIASGLPIESDSLRAALEAALTQKG